MKHLIQYAMSFCGTPYIWGGDDPIKGFDCSGFVQEILASSGIELPKDFTADGLYHYLIVNGEGFEGPAQAGALAFFGKASRITHVGFMLDDYRMIEAGGGDSRTTDEEVAARKNAYIRVRSIFLRKDLKAIVRPVYPFDEF